MNPEGMAELVVRANAILERASLPPGPRNLVAIGWATVDADRAAHELAPHLGPIEGGGFIGAPPDLVLGANCRLGRPIDGDWPSVVLLEPSTEGHLAAFLARNGEGVAVAYVATAEDPMGSETDTNRSKRGDGPFGLERVNAGGTRWGPFVALIAPGAGEPGGGSATAGRPATAADRLPSRDDR